MDPLVERDDLVYDVRDLIWLWGVDANLIALVDTQFDLDLMGLVVVLETEQCCVDLELVL